MLDKAKLGKVDAVIGQKRKLDIEVQDLAAGRFPEELIGRLWNASMIGDDEEYWPFAGRVLGRRIRGVAMKTLAPRSLAARSLAPLALAQTAGARARSTSSAAPPPSSTSASGRPRPRRRCCPQELKKLLDVDREEARRQAPRGDRPAPRVPRAANPTGEAQAPRACSSSPSCCGKSRAGSTSSRWTTSRRALEKCTQKKGDCEQPKEPRIDLKEAEALYRELHDKFPTFRRMDLVTYLIGFAAKEDQREDEAMDEFQEVIDAVPAVAAATATRG